MKRLNTFNKTGHSLRMALVLALAGLGSPGHARTADKPLNFAATFSDKGQPASQYFKSMFRSDGMEHTLEVWRLNDEHLKRVTDGALEVHVERKSGDPEFRMTVLDHKKRLMTEIDRSNLYRIGNFTDWFDLAHGIKHPRGEYRLAKGKAPEGMPRALQACDWYDLTQGQKISHICWSASSKLPLLVSASDGQLVWQITKLERKPVSKMVFAVHDQGYIRNDANQDIAHD